MMCVHFYPMLNILIFLRGPIGLFWRVLLVSYYFQAGKCYSLSCVRLIQTPWTVDRQAPLSLGFPRQENWSGLPFPSPGDFPNPGIKPVSPTLQAGSLQSEPLGWSLNPLRLALNLGLIALIYTKSLRNQ